METVRFSKMSAIHPTATQSYHPETRFILALTCDESFKYSIKLNQLGISGIKNNIVTHVPYFY
jgi:hypothetical protein